MNRGVGGPLLCIGDLLSDVGERGGEHQSDTPSSSSPSSPSFHLPPTSHPLPPSHLHRLFQEKGEKVCGSISYHIRSPKHDLEVIPSAGLIECGACYAVFDAHPTTVAIIPSHSYFTVILRNLNLRFHQENYDKLNEALKGTDHSWTALTLKLCATLETADKLLQSANTNVEMLAEKIGELESIMKRGDSAVATARAVLRKETKKEQHAVER